MPIYRVPIELSWGGVGTPGVNVFHVRTDGVVQGTDADLQQAVDSIHAFYVDVNNGGSTFGTPLAGGLKMNLGTVVNVQTQEVASPSFTEITTSAGGRWLPQANQIVIGWRTTIAARRGQGRTFMGPLNDGCQDSNGAIKAEYRTDLLAAANAFVSRSTAANGWAVGVYGLQVAGGGPDGAKVLRDITGAAIGTQFAVLRSRRD